MHRQNLGFRTKLKKSHGRAFESGALRWQVPASLPTVSDFIFILMSMVTEMNGHGAIIFIIIDHDNDDSVKDGSEGLAQSP